MSVKIGNVDCRHELDPYHHDTKGLTLTTLNIYPESRKASVTQDYDTNSTSMGVWNGIDIEVRLRNTLDGGLVREFLESDDGQKLLDAICDGWSRDWNGSNYIGSLDDEATSALDELTDELESCFTDEPEYFCEDLFDELSDSELGVYFGQPDESLRKLASKLKSESDCYIIDDVYDYLVSRRNQIEEE
jgi:hypothetical protein